MTDLKGPEGVIDNGEPDESTMQISFFGGIAAGESPPEEDDPDAEADAGNRKLLGHGTLLLILVVLCAAGGIYFMRLTQTEISSTLGISEDVEEKIEIALARYVPSKNVDEAEANRIDRLLKDTDAVIEMFATDRTTHQVPIELVKKNPFTLPVAAAPVAPAKNTAPAVTKAKPKVDARRQELERKVDGLKLETVINGHKPMAIISGEIARVGQTIGSFKVRKISGRSVQLEGGGHTFTIMMQD